MKASPNQKKGLQKCVEPSWTLTCQTTLDLHHSLCIPCPVIRTQRKAKFHKGQSDTTGSRISEDLLSVTEMLAAKRLAYCRGIQR